MNCDDTYVARMLLKSRICAASGQEYEDLFTSVMRKAVPGFRQIKPQGSRGDRKNDGYTPIGGRYWQVYAPEEPAGKSGVAAAKALEDFEGLKAFWDTICPVREYNFAFNDKYKGSYPDIEKAVAGIRESHELDHCDVFLAAQLEDQFMSLDDKDMRAVIGHIPTPDDLSMDLQFEEVSEVIGYLMKDRTPVEEASLGELPDWDEKIRFNCLGPVPESMMEAGAHQLGSLEAYFKSNSRWLRSRVRDRLVKIYASIRDETLWKPDGTTSSGDSVFFQILSTICPRSERAVTNAGIVLLAYFFETCDVFEEPS